MPAPGDKRGGSGDSNDRRQRKMVTDGQDAASAREVIDFVSSITDTARLRIEENLPHGFVRLKVAEAERRQAQHDIRLVEDIVTELARNSRDAGSRRVLVGFQKEQARYRKIAVLDDGCGIPPDMHQVVFEPRVTSKRDDFEEDRYGVHGRGMALFSIRTRTPDARIAASRPGAGTAIVLTADTTRVPERSDQATLPRLETADGVLGVGSGPHNVARVLLEMSVDCASTDFYLGSFAEIIATVRRMPASASAGAAVIWQAVADAADARELADLAAVGLGIPISERNAYRVLAGDIRPVGAILALADRSLSAGPSGRPSPGRADGPDKRLKARSPLARIAREDLEEIGSEAQGAAERVLGRYYLRVTGEPRVRKGRGKLTVSFHVASEEEEE